MTSHLAYSFTDLCNAELIGVDSIGSQLLRCMRKFEGQGDSATQSRLKHKEDIGTVCYAAEWV